MLRMTAHRADASLVCPVDVNDVHWATGQVVKLKCGREHT